MARKTACRIASIAAVTVIAIAGFAGSATDVVRADALLDEMVEFTGQILYIESKVPAVVIGAVRNDAP